MKLLYCVCLVVGLFRVLKGDEVIDAYEMVGGETQCAVQEHGAVGDGQTNDRKAIQAAIDACAAKESGGVVIFEEHRKYLTGSLTLPSGVTIRIPEGAALLASTKIEDYSAFQDGWYLITVEKATKVAIQGPGQIDGQASKWTEMLDGEKSFKNWTHPDCPPGACRPSLIGIKDSSQVSLDRIDLLYFVSTALHIQRSVAVAVVIAHIETDMSFPNTKGIVVDGSKRSFIGQTTIITGDSSITAVATTGQKPLESLLVDHVTLKSSAAAFQVGPVAKTDVKTVVVQHARIGASKRGLSVQLQDTGNIHDVWFTNVTLTTEHSSSGGAGAGEGIHVSVKPAEADSQKPLGKMSNIWFGNISCVSEGGFLLSGDVDSTIDGITIKDSSLEMTKLTSLPGSFRDFQPSKAGLLNTTSVPAIFLEYANHVILSGIDVVIGSPLREEWGGLLEMTPHTVHALQFENFHMHDESAHPSVPFVTPMKKMSQLGDFFKHSIKEWAHTIGQKGFISLQENAAFGVSGRRAASSGSPIVMGLLLIVLLAILVRYCCLPALRRGSKAHALPG